VTVVDVPASDKPGYDRLRRRRVMVLAVAALAVVASVGGLLVATTIKSLPSRPPRRNHRG
jgi:hypothetical protein